MTDNGGAGQWTWTAVVARARTLHTRLPAPLDPDDVPASFRRAAVLALLAPRGEGTALVCTRRASALRDHSGEVCLPGGRIEPGETPEDAAAREACEELVLDQDAIEITGRLDETWSGAGNLVHPIVALYHGNVAGIRPGSSEVDELLVADIADIARRERQTVKLVRYHGYVYIDDVIDAGQFEIYGMTADVVLDLLAFLGGGDRRRVPARTQGLRHFVRNPLVPPKLAGS